MQTVSRFEANLLRLLYFFFRREPLERALPLVENRMEQPPCLSRNAVRLIEQGLAKGCTHELARRGGWRVERHLRGDRVIEGRLWQRTDPQLLGFRFSASTLDFLIWITACRPNDKEGGWQPQEEDLTPADRLLLYFAYEMLREGAESLGVSEMRRRQPFNQHGLCWLAFPGDYRTQPAEHVPNLVPWVSGPGAEMVEALQPELAEQWLQVEGNKERIVDPVQMRLIGSSQEKVLERFLTAIETVNRFDLARFMLQVAKKLLPPGVQSVSWIAGLQTVGLRLADRAATYQGALAFVRQLPRLQGWARLARQTRFFDDGYSAAQLWLADWEMFQGDELADRAQNLIRQVDPMR